MRGWLNRMVLLMALAGVARCGTTSAPPAAPAPPGVPTAEIGGLWTGTIQVTPCELAIQRCNAINNVTFALTQYGSQVTGNYTCAPGSMSCRHGGADDAGTIAAGSISGNRVNLAVKIAADNSDCYYSGAAASATQARGVYVCYRGGMLIEEGVFNLVRQEAE